MNNSDKNNNDPLWLMAEAAAMGILLLLALAIFACIAKGFAGFAIEGKTFLALAGIAMVSPGVFVLWKYTKRNR